ERGDVTPTCMDTLARQLTAQPACTHEGMLQVQLVNPAHECQIRIADWPRQVIHRSTAHAQQFGLARDGQIVATVDHGFALSNPALVSARSKKSFSSANCPILACSGARSTGSVWEPPPKISAAPSSRCRFHSAIWLGCNSNSLHRSAIVRSSSNAARATRALNARLWVRRVRRADFLTIKNSFSPDRFRSSIMPGVSTYRAVQICGATSIQAAHDFLVKV